MNKVVIGQTADSGLWAVCDCSGKITLCGRDAAELGVRPGNSAASMIAEECISDFEDALRVAERGGFVDLLLTAARGFVAHIISEELFGAPVILVSFYKNKNEYLAEALSKDNKIGKVFSHMEGYVSGATKTLGSITPKTDVYNRARAFVVRDELISCISAEARTGDVSSDVSALFEMIAERFSANAEGLSRVEFLSEIRDSIAICPIDPRMFAGVTVMCAAVGARISGNGECRVVLGADANSATLRVVAKMRGKISKCFKCSDIGKLCELVPSTPAEIIILEGMISEFGWDSIFECGEDSSFSLRIAFDRGADPDRLKFREEIAVAAEYVDVCMDYLHAAFSSEPQ